MRLGQRLKTEQKNENGYELMIPNFEMNKEVGDGGTGDMYGERRVVGKNILINN